MSNGKILFQLSGSIACFKACQVISKLVQGDYEVEIVATKSAMAFVGEATLEGLTGRKPHVETFASGEYMNHIHLIRWADLIILCPATANTLSKMAAGVGDDLLTTLFLAHDFKKPYLVAPAMNTTMMQHPATQAALQRLGEWGIEVLASGSGALACGEVGEGRLLEPDAIFAAIELQLLKKRDVSEVRVLPRSPRAMKVLVTSGGTREPIDGVRSIANFSTGKTGATIADYFAARGHQVTLMRAKESTSGNRLEPGLHEKTFVTFEQLYRQMQLELSSNAYDLVIHAAAVSDYSVNALEVAGRPIENLGEGKLDSNGDLVIRLKRTPKIVDELRSMAHEPNLKVIAFKLTNTDDLSAREQAVRKLAAHAGPDWIVHNDLNDIDPSGKRHPAVIYAAALKNDVHEIARVENKLALAEALEELALASLSGAEI